VAADPGTLRIAANRITLNAAIDISQTHEIYGKYKDSSHASNTRLPSSAPEFS
jgi:hypothetical protein